MAEAPERKYVVKITAEELFGQYSYELAPEARSEALSQLFILYGENGTGKTTVLWLLNHLLSKELGRGHRTFLAKTQFKSFSAYLNDGTILSAVRPKSQIGTFTMTMTRGRKKTTYDYKVDEKGTVSAIAKNEASHEAFRAELPDLRLTFLADDRKISTAVTRKELIRSRQLDLWVHMQKQEELEKNPSALQPALDALREWARSRALEGSALGQRDVNAIYIDIIRRLSRTTEFSEPLSELVERLTIQRERSALFSRFGLTSEIDIDSIIKTISGSPEARQYVIAQVLKPYLDSNEARFAALDSLQGTLATFVDELNTAFFKKKLITFDLRTGVGIRSGGQSLNPELLSSGEKQLLVLFCNVAQASDRPAIFIIDEPELSLNVNWQRRLIEALQKLASENVQFIFATHSLRTAFPSQG